MDKKSTSPVSKEGVQERQDTWWITDEVLNHAVQIVAQQFVHDESRILYTPEEFAQRATYVMRQNCPIVYSYFYQASNSDTLPYGTLQIILAEIKKKRIMFMVKPK